MSKVIVTKHLNTFIRKELNMRVNKEVPEAVDVFVKKIVLEQAKERADKDGRKTIMAKDI